MAPKLNGKGPQASVLLLAAAWVAWLLLSASSEAILVPGIDLPALIRDSDLIVAGRVTHTRREGPATINLQGNILEARLMAAELEVERPLKGQAGTPIVAFKFLEPHAPVGYGEVTKGDFGVFFLKKTAGGFEVLDPRHPSVVAAPGTQLVPASLLDEIIQEVAHVLDSPETSAGDRWLHLDAVLVLRSVVTPRTTSALRAATNDKDPLPRIWAIAALLERNDLSLLPIVKEIALSPTQSIDDNLMKLLGSAVWDVKDPRAIPTLAQLVRAPNVDIRRGAAGALRNAHDPSAIGPLTQALYDTDSNVRYSGVIGLAEVTGTIGEWAPALDTFLKDEQRYVDYWGNWAKTRKKRSSTSEPQ